MKMQTVIVIESMDVNPVYVIRGYDCGQIYTLNIYEAAHFRTTRDAKAWMEELELSETKWRIVEHAISL
jgi:hypothetical protein